MSDENNLLLLLRAAGKRRNNGEGDEAYARYLEVWHQADKIGDDYHACIAAHMLGVTEPMPLQEKLRWHIESLNRADKVRDERTTAFYASIYMNLAYVYVHIGCRSEALAYCLKAHHHTSVLDDDDYGKKIRASIAAARADLYAEEDEVAAEEE